MFNKINEAVLLREIAELKKEIATLKDEQIKQRRDQNDQMYNLDSDNVPTLNGIVKEIRLIVKDGAVNGALIIQAINSAESEAQILASHINLSGMTINLNAGEGITITSPNFSVTKEGNMTCTNAEIKKTCALATDLGDVEEGEGNGMLIGPIQETEAYKAETRLSVTRSEDGPGIRFRSKYHDKSDGNDYTSDFVMTGKGIKMVLSAKREGIAEESAAVGINLESMGQSATGKAIVIPRPYLVSPAGSAMWTDYNGNIFCDTNGRGITESDVPAEISLERYPFDGE